MTYIGAEVMITPLGENAADNWSAACANKSGISLIDGAGYDGESVYLSKIIDFNAENRFTALLIKALDQIKTSIDQQILASERTIVLISSTKGQLDKNMSDQFGEPVAVIKARYKLFHDPIVISNACISGVLAINAANNFISSKLYDHAIVVGCDVISSFVIYGFQSLFAISDKPCAPFDSIRNGITMGEGCGAVVVSNSSNLFADQPLELLSGTSANDANHISGPSRTGEGLYRSVKKTMEINKIDANDIDFISAHGTATVFNDEMESIAFDRLDLNRVPLNSLKGYFGHTLGAAGVIETIASMQMMRHGMLLKSLGFQAAGTSKTLNVITENEKKELNTILKTASGFGGGNASLIIRSI